MMFITVIERLSMQMMHLKLQQPVDSRSIAAIACLSTTVTAGMAIGEDHRSDDEPASEAAFPPREERPSLRWAFLVTQYIGHILRLRHYRVCQTTDRQDCTFPYGSELHAHRHGLCEPQLGTAAAAWTNHTVTVAHTELQQALSPRTEIRNP